MPRFSSPTPPHHPVRWHAACAHPVLHRLWVALVLGGWLYWSCRYGLPWAAMLSQHFGPGWQPVLFCVFGAGWLFMIIPWVAGGLYACSLRTCQPLPTDLGTPQRDARDGQTPRSPALPGRRTTERIIFSPDAAEKRFGVRGTIIVERETED